MEHSAEWLRGAIHVAKDCEEPVAVAYYTKLLAAAEAREKEALGTDWEDTDVQAVYRMLGSSELPGPAEEHWEGKVARMVVAHMRSRAAEAREAQPTAADVIREAKAALKDKQEHRNDSSVYEVCYDWCPECLREKALATISAWEAGNE